MKRSSANRDGGLGQGGGIYNSGTLALTNCTIAENWAQGGNGFADNSGNAIGNGGGAYGGGIYSEPNGQLTLVNCLVSNNIARGGNGGVTTNVTSFGLGGGIFSSGTVCTLFGCTLFDNWAIGGIGGGGGSGDGGGISVHDGLLVNCTIVTNVVEYGDASGGNGSGPEGDANGGGVEAATTGSTGVTLNSCTLQGNQAYGDLGGYARGGGIAVFQSAPLTLENTIVSGNVLTSYFNGNTAGPDVYGTVTSGGYNFIGQADGTSAGWIGSDLTGTGASPIDPQFGPLQNNGGPTPTLALPPTSPAVNQGKSFGLTTDQRGFPRPFPYPGVANAAGGDGSDIGAYEISSQRPLLVMKFVSAQLVEILWPYDPAFPNNPVFGLQVLTTGDLSSGAGAWMDFTNVVRLIDNQYVARDRIVQKGPGQQGSSLGTVYRGSTGVTNVSFVPNPVTLPASNLAPTTATLNGSDVPIGGNTAYWFEYGYDTGQGINYDHTTVTNTLATSSQTNIVSCSIAGLLPLTPYHCQLVVTDDWGTQVGGAQPFTTPGYPPAVVTSVATSITTTSAVLNGTVDGNGQLTAGYFEYGAQPNGSPCCTDPTVIFTNTPQFYGPANYAVVPFGITISNLTPSTTYEFYIVAHNVAGTSQGVTNTFITAGLPPPTVVTLPATYESSCGDCTPFPILNGACERQRLGFFRLFRVWFDYKQLHLSGWRLQRN